MTDATKPLDAAISEAWSALDELDDTIRDDVPEYLIEAVYDALRSARKAMTQVAPESTDKAGEKDATRLDWLIEHAALVTRTPNGFWIASDHGIDKILGPYENGRAAIDAARDASDAEKS